MTNDALIAALSHLVSDAGNPETRDIDQLPTSKWLKVVIRSYSPEQYEL